MEIRQSFSYRLTEQELDEVNIASSKTIISELEALAMLVGLKLFGEGESCSLATMKALCKISYK